MPWWLNSFVCDCLIFLDFYCRNCNSLGKLGRTSLLLQQQIILQSCMSWKPVLVRQLRHNLRSIYNTALTGKNLYSLRIMAARRAPKLGIFFLTESHIVPESEHFGKSSVKMLEPCCNTLFTFIPLFNWPTSVAAVGNIFGGELLWQQSSFKGTLKSMWRRGHAEGR